MQQKNSRQFLFELCKRTLHKTNRRNNIILLNLSGSNNAPLLMEQPTFTCHDCDLVFNDIFAFLEHSYEQNSFDSIDAWKLPYTEDKFCKICLTYKKTRYALIYHIARHLEEAYSIKSPNNLNDQHINDRINLHNQPYFYRSNFTYNTHRNNKNYTHESWSYSDQQYNNATTTNQIIPMDYSNEYAQPHYHNDQDILQVPYYARVQENNENRTTRHFHFNSILDKEIPASATSTVTSADRSPSPGNLVIDEEERSTGEFGSVADIKQDTFGNSAEILQINDVLKDEEVQKNKAVKEKQQLVDKKKEYFKEMQRCKQIHCKFCQRSFHRPSDLVKHMNKYDTKCVVNVTCSICARVYRSRKLFERHQEMCNKQYRDEPRTFLCDLCGQAYARSNFLTTHLKHGHDKVQCMYCDKKYKDETALKAHEVNVHFKCDE